MGSKIKPFSVEITKKDGFMYINDAVGYFPKELVGKKLLSIQGIIEKYKTDTYGDEHTTMADVVIYREDFHKLKRDIQEYVKRWLFVVERVDGSRYLCNRDSIVDIFIYGEGNED